MQDIDVAALQLADVEKRQIGMMHKFFFEEEGQALVEYALLVSLIALIVIGVMTFVSHRLQMALSSFSF